MSFKNDIQATRFTAASGTAIIAQPIRLRGIFVSSNGGGAGSVVLNTEKKAGRTNLLTVDIPTGDVVSLNFPEDGILFPQGIFASTVTNVAAVTLLTDKYSGPNLTTTNK